MLIYTAYFHAVLIEDYYGQRFYCNVIVSYTSVNSICNPLSHTVSITSDVNIRKILQKTIQNFKSSRKSYLQFVSNFTVSLTFCNIQFERSVTDYKQNMPKKFYL